MDTANNHLSKLSDIQISACLQRIGFSGILAVHSQTLRRLHVACTTKIPFETLDIFLQKRFSLSLPDLYDKIVTRRRGGYCYELNGFFFYLLQGLGYEVAIYNAHLYDSQGFVIDTSQHMVLVVKLEALWLVDIGYGNGFAEPLLLDSHQPQQQGHRLFRCIHENGQSIVQQLNDGKWKSWYVFTKMPKKIADFEDRNDFHQTNVESVFFEKRICMIMHGDEALELVGNELTRTTPLKKHVAIMQEETIPLLLKTEFGIG